MAWEDADSFLSNLKSEKKAGRGFGLSSMKRGKTGHIYFIAEKDDDGENIAIKIGYSNKPNRRNNTLQTGNSKKLEILFRIPGTIPEEKRLHAILARHNIRREWFAPHPEVYHIMHICQTHGKHVPPMIEEIHKSTFDGIPGEMEATE